MDVMRALRARTSTQPVFFSSGESVIEEADVGTCVAEGGAGVGLDEGDGSSSTVV